MYLKLLIGIIYFKYVYSTEINVGTVLFTPADSKKKCWSNEQLALLRSRLVYQDILPQTHSLSMEDDIYVSALVNYMHLVIEKTKSMTSGKTRDINMKALSDTLGGYLHSIALPSAHYAFYAGKISYDSSHQLHVLYDEFKSFLRTDGSTWAPPVKPTEKLKREVKGFENNYIDNEKEPCDAIIYKLENGQFTTPMPYLDSKTKPSAIYLPLKDHPLRNIRSKSSAFILVKYYMTAVGCMRKLNATDKSLKLFNREFNNFIKDNVVPHLFGEDLYPAFGSVYRLQETLTNKGASAAADQSKDMPMPFKTIMQAQSAIETPLMGKAHGTTVPIQTATIPTTTTTTTTESATIEDETESDKDPVVRIELIAAGVVLLVWILIGVCYCCYRLKKKAQEQDGHFASPKAIFAKKGCSSPECHKKKSPKASSCCSGNEPCKKCSKPKCTRHVGFVLMPDGPKSVTSAPLSTKKVPSFPNKPRSSSASTGAGTGAGAVTGAVTGVGAGAGAEKAPVFGYNFETSSSSNDSSLDDSETSSGSNTPISKQR